MGEVLKYTTPIQLRFRDIDALGHVNSAVYFTYFELARVDYFNNLDEMDWSSMSLVVAKIEMEYKHQVKLKDKLFASVWVSRIGTKSFDMECSIVKEKNGEQQEVAKGKAILVCFNFKINETVPVPELWKQKMLTEA